MHEEGVEPALITTTGPPRPAGHAQRGGDTGGGRGRALPGTGRAAAAAAVVPRTRRTPCAPPCAGRGGGGRGAPASPGRCPPGPPARSPAGARRRDEVPAADPLGEALGERPRRPGSLRPPPPACGLPLASGVIRACPSPQPSPRGSLVSGLSPFPQLGWISCSGPRGTGAGPRAARDGASAPVPGLRTPARALWPVTRGGRGCSVWRGAAGAGLWVQRRGNPPGFLFSLCISERGSPSGTSCPPRAAAAAVRSQAPSSALRRFGVSPVCPLRPFLLALK